MSPQRHFEGIAVSGGVVTGKVFRLDPRRLSAEPRSIPDEKVAQEIERFMKAVEYSRKRIQKIRKRAEQATDASHGDPARRGRLLSASGFHLAEDGAALASKPCGENI